MNLRSIVMTTLLLSSTIGFAGGFQEDTLILNPTGGLTPIKKVMIGDWVWSRKADGEDCFRRVTNKKGPEKAQAVNLVVSDRKISCAYDQKFLTKENKWVKAGELTAGTKLLTDGKIGYEVQSVEKTQNLIDTYQLTVNKEHTYMVTDLGITAHNEFFVALPSLAVVACVGIYKILKSIAK